jgi:DNA-binding NarL/FixJ family response regulator
MLKDWNMSNDHRWTIRGIHPDLQTLVSTRAMVEKKTVGELVTEALASYLERPVEADVVSALLERVNALEDRLNQTQSSVLDLKSAQRPTEVSPRIARQHSDTVPPPTVVTATREEVLRKGGQPPITPEIKARVWELLDQGMSQQKICEAVGIAQGSVSKIKSSPRP